MEGACRKATCGAERRLSRGATVSSGGSGPPSELEGGPGVGRRGEKGPDPNPAFTLLQRDLWNMQPPTRRHYQASL